MLQANTVLPVRPVVGNSTFKQERLADRSSVGAQHYLGYEPAADVVAAVAGAVREIGSINIIEQLRASPYTPRTFPNIPAVAPIGFEEHLREAYWTWLKNHTGDGPHGRAKVIAVLTNDYLPQSKSARRSALEQRLRTIAAYEDGWAAPGSKAPRREAIADAWAFIDLLPDSAPSPDLYADEEGDVEFTWRQPPAADYINVGFAGDGVISFYARAIDAFDDTPFHRRALPAELLRAILTA